MRVRAGLAREGGPRRAGDPAARIRGGGLTAGFNATPMVDVILILTIFFMLVSRFSSAEQVPMELPHPPQSQAKVVRMPERIILNCRPVAGTSPLAAGRIPGRACESVAYSIGPNRPEPLAVIADRLAAWKRAGADLKVVIRADRRLPYQCVRDVMGLIARHNIEMLNVVAHVGEDE